MFCGFDKKCVEGALKGEQKMNVIWQKMASLSAKDWLLIVLALVVLIGIFPRIVRRLFDREDDSSAWLSPEDGLSFVRVGNSRDTTYSYGAEIYYGDAYGRRCGRRRSAHHARIAKRTKFTLLLLAMALCRVNHDNENPITDAQAYSLMLTVARFMTKYAEKHGVVLRIDLVIGGNGVTLNGDDEKTHEDTPPQAD